MKQGEERHKGFWQVLVAWEDRKHTHLTELAHVSQHINFHCLLWPGFLPVVSSYTHMREKNLRY